MVRTTAATTAPRRARRRAALVLAVALAVLVPALLPLNPAQAKRVYPTSGDVSAANSKAAKTRAAVKRLEKAITDADSQLNSLQTASEQASQAYDAALARQEQAQHAADATEAAAATAEASFNAAQTELGVFAADSYRSGGDLANVGALLTADGPGTLLDRANTISVLSSQRESVLQRVQSARVVAELLQQQALTSLARVQSATAAVQVAQKQAQAALKQQQLQVRTLDGQKATLRAQLTKLDKNAARLFQQRAAGLAAAAARKAAAAARKAALQRERNGGGGSGGQPTNAPAGVSVSTKAEAAKAVAFAKKQLGKWYLWGGAGPNRFDCSGLTMRSWENAGVTIPRVASWQYAAIEKIPLSSLRPGDLVFYATDLADYTTIHHVGMFVGNGQMIEAPHTGAKIRYASIWRPDLIGAGRP